MISFIYLLVGFVFSTYHTYSSFKEGLKDKNELTIMFILTLLFWPFIYAYFYFLNKLKKK